MVFPCTFLLLHFRFLILSPTYALLLHLPLIPLHRILLHLRLRHALLPLPQRKHPPVPSLSDILALGC